MSPSRRSLRAPRRVQGLGCRAIALARTEPVTLGRVWFLSEDQMSCMVREVYRDAAVVLEHAGHIDEMPAAYRTTIAAAPTSQQ